MGSQADRMRIAGRAAAGSPRIQRQPKARPQGTIQISARISLTAHRGLRMAAARIGLSVAGTVEVIGQLLEEEPGQLLDVLEQRAHEVDRNWGGRR